MKISEVIVDTSSEDKALAGLDVQTASIKLQKVQKNNLPEPPKRGRPIRPKGSIPSRPPLRPIA